MSETVGSIEYTASIELSNFIRDQRRLSSGLDDIERDGSRLATTMTKVAAAVNVLAAAMAAVKVARMADEFRTLEARVSVVAGNVEAGAAAFKALNDISTRTQTAVANNVELFNRLNTAIVQMGGSQSDTLRVTELVSKAIKVSGASAAEAASAQLQFAQALGSGKLAGDELKSLLESSPYLMRQLADSMGVPVGALKKMGEEGELTSQRILDALGKAAGRINADFEKIPATIEGSMQVARDAASRAAVEFDKLSGGSTVLTGVIKGVGDVLDTLATRFNDASKAGGDLGKDKAVQDWAKDVRHVLSYVVDAADLTWQTLSVLGRNVVFVFRGIQAEIGGIAAQFAAVARGDFAAAKVIGEEMKRDAEQRRKELDEADRATLARAKLYGQQLRDAWAISESGGRNGGTRGGRGVTSDDITIPGRGGGGGGSSEEDVAKARKRNAEIAEAYLASLRMANMQGAQLLDERERMEIARLKKDLDAKSIGIMQYEAGRAEIEAKYRNERDKLFQQENDAAKAAGAARLKQIEDEAKARADAERSAREEAEKTDPQRLMDEILGKGQDPTSKLLAENDAKLAAINEYEAARYLTEEQASMLRVALVQREKEQIDAIEEEKRQKQAAILASQLGAYSNTFGSMADIIGTFAGKQSTAYKAMFAVSKAFSIAQAIVSTSAGVTKALQEGGPYPMNLLAAASVAAAGAAQIASIRGASFGGGRQYGGPVDAGTMYRVNETGRPEMFTARSGEQYMLPTKNGKVTPANKVGQGGQAAARPNDGPVNINLKGVAMPNGMFAINPGDLADAIRQARRDLFF